MVFVRVLFLSVLHVVRDGVAAVSGLSPARMSPLLAMDAWPKSSSSGTEMGTESNTSPRGCGTRDGDGCRERQGGKEREQKEEKSQWQHSRKTGRAGYARRSFVGCCREIKSLGADSSGDFRGTVFFTGLAFTETAIVHVCSLFCRVSCPGRCLFEEGDDEKGGTVLEQIATPSQDA